MKDISLEIEIKHPVTKNTFVAGQPRTFTTYEGTGDWQYAALSDANLTLEIVGVIMNEDKGGTYSYPFELDVEENQHIFGSASELRGDSIYNRLNGARCRLVANGMPIVQGKLDLDSTVDIKQKNNGHHKVEVKIVSRNKSYEDKIEGAKLRDLDFRNLDGNGRRIQIGYALPTELSFYVNYRVTKYPADRVHISHLADYTNQPEIYFEFIKNQIGEYYYRTTGGSTVEHKKEYRYMNIPHFLMPRYEDTDHAVREGFVNVQNPYNPQDPLAFPYCNVRTCVQKYKKAKENDDKDNEWVKARGVSIIEPDAVNSAPCFYVGFVFDIAMKQLGLAVTSNSLNGIMDYKRMAFWHSDPRYDMEDSGLPIVNNNENGLILEFRGYLSGQQHEGANLQWAIEDGKVYRYQYDFDQKEAYADPRCHVQKAYATADNLPDITVKDLIENLTKGFGARIIYDDYMESLKVVLLRDIMRDSANAIEIPCDAIINPTKTENDNRGFCLKYSGAQSASYNTITKVRNETQGGDEAAYNYYGYKDVEVLGTPNTYATYADMSYNVSCYDMSLYIDPITGNMFRIKVDDSAETQGEWFPSVFEVAGYRDAFYGDISYDMEHVTTVNIPFAPVMSTISNVEEMRIAKMTNSKSIPSPIYAQYVDGEFHVKDELHRKDISAGNIPLETIVGPEGTTIIAMHVDVSATLYMHAVYEGGGDSPVFDNECENVIGIMRGSGSNATLMHYDYNYDGMGSEKYIMLAGTNAEFFADSVNHFGQMFDYDGDTPQTEVVTRENAVTRIQQLFPGIPEKYYTTYANPEFRVAWHIADKAWNLFDGTTSDVIGRYPTKELANFYKDILVDLLTLIFTSQDKVTIYFPSGLGYAPDDAISLKLKAEKPILGHKELGYYPCQFQQRGLWDKFYVDWAKFYVDHNIVNLTARMELASLNNIISDTTRWFKFGDFVGLIKSGTAKLLDNGMVDVDIKLAYL